MERIYFNVYGVNTEDLVHHLDKLLRIVRASRHTYIGPYNGTTCELIFDAEIDVEALEKAKLKVSEYLRQNEIKHVIH